MVIKAICNKGFSGNSSVLPCSKFSAGGRESIPLPITIGTLTGHIVNQLCIIFNRT